MKKLVLLLCFLTSMNSSSDEAYSFQVVKCSMEDGFFYMRSVRIWNIGETIWPTLSKDALKNIKDQILATYGPFCHSEESSCSDEDYENNEKISKQLRYQERLNEWVEHEKAMKSIEAEYGLYAYGEHFGIYHEAPLFCDLGDVSVSIEAETKTRRYVLEDDPEVKQLGMPKVIVKGKDNTVLHEGYFHYGNTLVVRKGDGIIPTIEYCAKGSSCGEEWSYQSTWDGKIPSNLKYHIYSLR